MKSDFLNLSKILSDKKSTLKKTKNKKVKFEIPIVRKSPKCFLTVQD